MGNNYIRFGFTALNGTNKAGTLTPDEDGYYPMVLGGLDVYNSANQFYPYEPAKELFTSSSQLMRRVSNGALRGEYGHPKMEAGQSYDSFAQRILSIYESEVSHHIKEVTLDFDRIKDASGRRAIAIIGKVKPCGPKGDALKASLENKSENVCFSIRAFTRDDHVGRQTNRVLKNIVTWDYVNEPGISIANKFQSPALEEIAESMFSRRHLERAGNASAHGVAQEAIRLNVQELFSSMGWSNGDAAPPAYLNW
jgi:hypothetical protein